MSAPSSLPTRLLWRTGLVLFLVGFLLPRASVAAAPVQTNGFRLMDLSHASSGEFTSDLAARFSMVPTGLHRLDGVPFSIGSVVVLTGMEQASEGQSEGQHGVGR